jgi:hypothetical protein
MSQNFKIKLYSGIFTFVYFIIPILQDNSSYSFSRRFEDYYFFFLSSSIYGFMQMFYTNSIMVYFVQLISWIISWWLLFIFIRSILPSTAKSK